VQQLYDLVGVGLGPFNLALAALADPLEIRAGFFDACKSFSWHPGLLMEGTTLQVPFLADLVTLVDPTSRWSFLNYLRHHDRMYPFYFSERFHIPRREYDDYCRWVASSLPSCHFGFEVVSVEWDDNAFLLTCGNEDAEPVRARNVVLGVGTEPFMPAPLTPLLGKRMFHSANYLQHKAVTAEARDVVVIGSGQSGAEVFLDLLHGQPSGGYRLTWVTSSPAFAPMEYSKLGLEHFTPDYMEHFRSLPQQTRDRLLPNQWQLYKAISADVVAEIYDVLYERGIGGVWPDVILSPDTRVQTARCHGERFELLCQTGRGEKMFPVTADVVVCATGYANRQSTFLGPMSHLIDWDDQGRYRVDGDYRVSVAPQVSGGLYVQNAELHTHGVGTPDLGLGAHRAAVILNAVMGNAPYRLPRRTAFTTFTPRSS
jgi:lysine N6-hydroxylase